MRSTAWTSGKGEWKEENERVRFETFNLEEKRWELTSATWSTNTHHLYDWLQCLGGWEGERREERGTRGRGGRNERERGSERGLLIRSAVVDPSRIEYIAIQLVKCSGCSRRRSNLGFLSSLSLTYNLNTNSETKKSTEATGDGSSHRISSNTFTSNRCISCTQLQTISN